MLNTNDMHEWIYSCYAANCVIIMSCFSVLFLINKIIDWLIDWLTDWAMKAKNLRNLERTCRAYDGEMDVWCGLWKIESPVMICAAFWISSTWLMRHRKHGRLRLESLDSIRVRMIGCHLVGVKCEGRGRKTWGEHVKDDMKLLWLLRPLNVLWYIWHRAYLSLHPSRVVHWYQSG